MALDDVVGRGVSRAPLPLYLDVDTGVDDAVCLVAVLRGARVGIPGAKAGTEPVEPAVDVLGVGTVCGNVPLERVVTNTLQVVDAVAPERQVPVARGAARPLVRDPYPAISHGTSGLGDLVLPDAGRDVVAESAAMFLRNAAAAHPGRLAVLATGPLTNIASALVADPGLAAQLGGITLMGGGLAGGNVTLAAEFNMYHDPEAARVVFESGVPITMVGLDVTLRPQLPPGVVRAVARASERGIPGAGVVGALLDFMTRRQADYGGDPPNLHDVVAYAALARPDLFTFAEHTVWVGLGSDETRGATLADFNGVTGRAPNARVAVDIDVDGFWAWFVARFDEPLG